MNGKLALLAIAVLCVGCEPTTFAQGKWSSHTQGLPFVVGYDRGKEAMKESGKPGMFFVTTTWCGWCKKLAKDNFKDPAVKALLERFVLVLVDGDTEREAARRLGAKGYPHIVFQSAYGRKVQTVRGYQPPQKFKGLVEKALRVAE